MISLGLRLVVNGGREAVTRLVILTVTAGLGVGLLLTAVAATNAAVTWNNRHAWFWTGTTSVVPPAAAAGTAPLWWHSVGDFFDGQQIERFDVAATGASSPVPPGLARDPAPGTYYASPALVALMRSTPASQLSDRYPGHLAGTVSDGALPSPSSLVVVVGRTPAQLAKTPNTVPVTSVNDVMPGSFLPPSYAQGGPPVPNPRGLAYFPRDAGGGSSSVDLILAVAALAILTPVLIFIGTATRLSAARREERFAAMRLAGATRGQVSLIAAIESTAAAVLGTAIGFGLFFLLRIPVAGIPFIGQPFFPAELTLSLPDILLVALGVPLFAALAARMALRRVNISPLGVARRARPKPPGTWRVVPLLSGLAELGFWTVHGHPASESGQVQAFASSFFIILVGLFIAGPWLTMAAAAAMARWTSRPATLLAARRIGDDPKAAFRAVSGLVLALFITTVAVVAISTQDAKEPTRFGTVAVSNLMIDQIAAASASGYGVSDPGPAAPAAALAARLDAIGGIQGVAVLRVDPALTVPAPVSGPQPGQSQGTPFPANVVSCAQLATVPVLGRCPAGATAAAIPAGTLGPNGLFGNQDTNGFTWPAANVPAARLDTLGVDAIAAETDGTTAAIEQARTVLETGPAYPGLTPPFTLEDYVAGDDAAHNGYQQLANVVILVSLPIAGCTLVAGIAAGLADRKRPFSLLRLAGARLSTLRGVVALEGAVPLLSVAAVAIGTGFAGAAMFAQEAQQHPMVAPGAAYYLLTAGGILVSLGIIAATFPLLARITGPEVARNE